MIPEFIRFYCNQNTGFFIDVRTGDLFKLNETGTLAFEEIQKGSSTDEIIRRIVQEYDIEARQAKEDVVRFIALMHQGGTICAK